ncbi:MAG: hypothetical protein LBI71_04615 [Enterobacteriaceae bacterium]|jgi:hypothetical protein|nr:hypothetical protein [Enterobacteriaceae bacterium]
MKKIKKYFVYSLSLSMMLFAHSVLANKYYNVKFINKSNGATVTLAVTNSSCMYDIGPKFSTLYPHQTISFDIQDSNNSFAGCAGDYKDEVWSIQYAKPNSETKYCYVEFLQTPFGSEPWMLYFNTVEDCSIPLSFTCNDQESKCNGGEDVTSMKMYINN